MKELIKDSVRIYNSLRPHWSCNMMTPTQMHKQSEFEIRSFKKSVPAKVNIERN